MKNGWVVKCDKCGAKIDEFSCADEWFCDCGNSGELQYDNEGEDEDDQ